MGRSFFASAALTFVVFNLAGLLAGSFAAHAGPCTAQIAQVEQEIRQAQAATQPGGAGVPSAAQSVGAQLHHQPTPGSVAGAEDKARDAANAALNNARAADAAGDATRCARALADAKSLYGLQ